MEWPNSPAARRRRSRLPLNPTPKVEVKGLVMSAPAGGSDGFAVNLTSFSPTGLLCAADRVTVDSQTKVLGNTNLGGGDVVADGLIAARGESAGAIASSPLQVVVDLKPSTAYVAMTAEMTRRAERRALETFRHEKAKLDRQHDKFKAVRK